MKIIHTGDLNIGYNLSKTEEEKLEMLITEINGSKADILVIAGDIVKAGLEKEYVKAKEILDRINLEKVFVPGNRDFFNGGNVPWSDYIYHLETALDIKTSKNFRRDGQKPLILERGYVLVGICTPRRDEKGGAIGHSQKKTAEYLFWDGGAEKYKILVMHHHLLPVPIGGLEENIIKDVGDIIRMTTDFGVNLVLTGHQHHPWASRYSSGINNTIDTYILTCGSPTVDNLRGFRFNSYNVIEIDLKSKKLEGYVKVLTGELDIKNFIPMDEFYKIPSMTSRQFLESPFSHYVEGYK